MTQFKGNNWIALWLAIMCVVSCKENTSVDPDPRIEVVPCYSDVTPRGRTAIQGDYIVTLKNNLKLTSGRLSSASRGVLAQSKIDSSALIDTFDGFQKGFLCHLSDKELERLRVNETIALIEQDRFIYITGACVQAVDSATVGWGTNRVGYADGTGRTAWLIDTGIDIHHEDLNVDAQRSRCFINDETSVEDRSGHGTHVAGVIAAKNNAIGTLGVASGANVVALKVLNQIGEGRISSVIKALAYAGQYAQRGDVVNISLVSDTISQSLDNAVISLADHGILFAISSGNGGKNAGLISPARVVHANVFVVSAINKSDQLASFSNYGNEVVKWATPGVDIVSTYPGDQYATMSGTSMAAPHMAGLLLLDGRNFGVKGEALQSPDGGPYLIPHKR